MPASLLEILNAIPDHRRAEGKRFDLATVLLYSILGMVAGANSYRQMHEFIRIHLQRLNEAFGLRLPYSPSYTGLRLIWDYLKVDQDEIRFGYNLLKSVNKGQNISPIISRMKMNEIRDAAKETLGKDYKRSLEFFEEKGWIQRPLPEKPLEDILADNKIMNRMRTEMALEAKEF